MPGMPERRCNIRGDFDIATVPQHRAALRRAINSGDADVLVDCAQMTFIDSTGITALLEAHALLADRGRRMLVANVQPRLRRAFDVLGVADLLSYERVEPEALTRGGRRAAADRRAIA
jgi:anti-anti-sigma factor